LLNPWFYIKFKKMGQFNTSIPFCHYVQTKEFRELLFAISSPAEEVTDLLDDFGSKFARRSHFEAILLILGINSLYLDNSDDEAELNFLKLVIEELPLAISPELEQEILDKGNELGVFIGERLMYYKEEMSGLLYGRENDDEWYYKIKNVAYLVIGKPLANPSTIAVKKLEEFDREIMRADNLHRIFVEKVLSIATTKPFKVFHSFRVYDQSIASYLDKYQREFGEVKYKQILTAVLSANKVQKALILMDTKHFIPSAVDIIATVMSLTYFLFAKKTTIAIGSVIFLHTWHTTTNLKYQTLNDDKLTALFVEVIQRSMKMG
jgi:hypothetical protein